MGTRIWQVIAASSVGTMIEWYDFYIFGSLATVISPLFYPQGNDTLAYFAYLSTFAVGFIVRPFGALFFGRIGDLVGRKYAFLITLLIMGGATAVIGILPTYASIGILAPIALLLIRVLQGLALGGEYGGAACMSPSMFRMKSAAFTRASSKSRQPWDCSSHWQYSDRPELHDQGSVWSMGLADSLPDLHFPCWYFPLHQNADERVSHLSAHQEHGHDFSEAPQRSLYGMG